MYYLVFGLLYLVSLLPWFILYGISDFLAMLVYHVFKYRRDVVMSNLTIAFPEKTITEKEKIAKDFYRLFTDTMIESIKLLSLSKKGLQKKYFGNSDLFDEVVNQGKNLQVHAMHNFNWEIVNLNVAIQLHNPLLCVYMPVKNKIFERITSDIRTRYGTIMLPAPEFKKAFIEYKSKPHILVLVADQNPGTPSNAYWLPFFGKMTPFVAGPEKGAKLNNTAVAFGHFYSVKRGLYSYDVKLVTMNAQDMPEGELTRQFVAYLEDCIRKHPENYLWSHRRWKHEYSEEFRENVIM